ncbi:hypothetical protein NE237_000845 [Protea cynaroides]|uniref:Uncharacterized protein n=1 Tax=Protea cynaroides TaxID=273540 RepID=A0A9Q0KSC3_9MAGN|nr:hypothetical protein NE237_000845 [Protea cynaroides]
MVGLASVKTFAAFQLLLLLLHRSAVNAVETLFEPLPPHLQHPIFHHPHHDHMHSPTPAPARTHHGHHHKHSPAPARAPTHHAYPFMHSPAPAPARIHRHHTLTLQCVWPCKGLFTASHASTLASIPLKTIPILVMPNTERTNVAVSQSEKNELYCYVL